MVMRHHYIVNSVKGKKKRKGKKEGKVKESAFLKSFFTVNFVDFGFSEDNYM